MVLWSGLETINDFTFFWQGGSPFSQWHRSDFVVDGFQYTCAEQYMMHRKALLFEDKEIAQQIMQAGYNPKEHKALGRKVKNFDPGMWEAQARVVVYNGNKAKFTQNPKLKEQLEATKGTLLVEASPYDKIWGIGLEKTDPRAHDRSTWNGKNWLGQVLTQLRYDLIKE